MLQNKFQKLANQNFPRLIQKLVESKKYSFEQDLCHGIGVKGFLKSKGFSDDFKGLYLLYKAGDGIPFYVGISKGVIGRLKQHYQGHNHFSGNLSYSIAKEKLNYQGQRAKMEEDNLKIGRDIVQRCSFQFIAIEEDVELYLFEVYVHLEFDTMNSFSTS